MVPLVGQQLLLWTFSRRFLEGDINDPTLNQALLDAFFGDFDLCGEFKNLYVYPLITEPQLVSQIPGDNNQLQGWYWATFEEILREKIPAILKSDINVVSESELVFSLRDQDQEEHNDNAVHPSFLYSSEFISKLREERCMCKQFGPKQSLEGIKYPNHEM